MDIIFKLLLAVHIVSGGAALLAGGLVFLKRKGDTIHKKIGYAFAISMYSCAVAGLLMSIINARTFLLCISVFTIYLLSSGLLSMKSFKANTDLKEKMLPLSVSMTMFSITLLLYALFLNASDEIDFVALFFGLGSLVLTLQDYRIYANKTKWANSYYLLHLQRMSGAYIAALTAFLVVNNTFLPGIVAWLLPSIVGGILITIYSRKCAIQKK